MSDSIPRELYDSVDLVAYARVVDDEPISNGALKGHVKLELDSVLKGDYSNRQFFYSNQTGAGNCVKIFKQGETVLILGFELNRFERIEQEKQDVRYAPPPIFDRQLNGTFRSSIFDEAAVDYWNNLANQSLVIHTNQCLVLKK
jgi:hypothetical protein